MTKYTLLSAPTVEPIEKDGIWYPVLHKDIPTWLAFAAEVERALLFVNKWRVAIDVGAHVGLVTRRLVGRFERVHAFEPWLPAFKCIGLNAPGALAHVFALGAPLTAFEARIAADPATHRAIVGDAGMFILTASLDGLPFPVPYLDFLKIDTDGSDLDVLLGGEKLIRREKPVIMIEDRIKKKHALGKEIRALLTSWGAKPILELKSPDTVYVWPS